MPLTYKGVVTSIGKMSKTATVTVKREVEHPKYQTFMTRTTKFLVHDEDHLTHLNDKVTIIHGIKYSNRKHFRLQSIDRRGKPADKFAEKAPEWLDMEAKEAESKEKAKAGDVARENRFAKKIRTRQETQRRLAEQLGLPQAAQEGGADLGQRPE